MNDALLHAITGLIGIITGGFVTFFTQRTQLRNELLRVREENKIEFQAEQTALHFLSHASYTDRSFDTLQKHLGGFEDNELRKILVRAGAIRTYREDGTEWWRLLSRNDEYIASKKK